MNAAAVTPRPSISETFGSHEGGRGTRKSVALRLSADRY